MAYQDREEPKLRLILNKKDYYFSRERLIYLTGLCQVYLEEYPDLKEFDLPNPTFKGEDLCRFFHFLDTLQLPQDKDACLGLYRVAIYFCLNEKYMTILRHDMTKYFEGLGLDLTFDQRGIYSYQGFLDKFASDVRKAFGLPPSEAIFCNPGPQGSPGPTGEETGKEKAKKAKKDRKQIWNAQRRNRK